MRSSCRGSGPLQGCPGKERSGGQEGGPLPQATLTSCIVYINNMPLGKVPVAQEREVMWEVPTM